MNVVTKYRMAIRWPTREQWARGRRIVYADMETPAHFLQRYDDLVPPALFAAARVELDALWKALGPLARTARRPKVEELWRTGQITLEEAQARIETPGDAAHDCRYEIRENQKRWPGLILVPHSYDRCVVAFPAVGAAHPLTTVRAYTAACAERAGRARSDWEAEVAQTPIDDAAWAEELARRAAWDEGR